MKINLPRFINRDDNLVKIDLNSNLYLQFFKFFVRYSEFFDLTSISICVTCANCTTYFLIPTPLQVSGF